MPTKKPTASKSSTVVNAKPAVKAKPAKKNTDAAKPANAKEKSAVKATKINKSATPEKTIAKAMPDSTKLKPVNKAPLAKAASMNTGNQTTSLSPNQMTAKTELKETTASAKADAKLGTETTTVSKKGVAPYQEKPGEEYMSVEQRKHFRLILLHWKQQLMEEVDRTVHHMQDEAANFPDPNDRATQEEEFSIELRTRDRERKLIKKIDEALQKIENNDYGFCDACGIEIGIRRLEARPTATLCIDCKTIDEIKERQMGGQFS